MFSISFANTLMVGWAETFMIMMGGFYLSNVQKVRMWKIIVIAFFQGLINYGVRKCPLVFELYTMVYIVTLSLLVYFILHRSFYKATIPILIGMVFAGMIEKMVLPDVLDGHNMHVSHLVQDPKCAVLCFIPIFIVSSICILIIKKKNITLWDVEK